MLTLTLRQLVEWEYQKEGSLMRKINELASLTGMTTRALRYYDQIGLLKPAKISESGYRLYDDKALETLQQILFFRETSEKKTGLIMRAF